MIEASQPEFNTHRLKHAPPFESWEITSSIPDRFRRVVSQFPQRPAIVSAQERVTYLELDRDSDQVAAELLRVRGAQQEVVSLLLPQNVNLITAALGILKAGKIVLALHPGLPQHRLRQLLSQAGSEVLISSKFFAQSALRLLPPDGLTFDVRDLRRSGQVLTPVALDPDQTAMLLPTSGSTGDPKLVMCNHAALLHNVWVNGLGCSISAEDRCGLFSYFGYGAGSAFTFNSLLTGSTLVVLRIEEQLPAEIVEQMRLLEISVTMMSAPLLAQLLAAVETADDLPALRRVRSSGQTLHANVVHEFRQKLGPHCLLVNGLASSEMMAVSHYVIPNDLDLRDGNVPVGYPVPGKEVLILNEQRQAVSPGTSGEIAVRSHFLSEGYWGDPDLTAKLFLPDPLGSEKRVFLTGDLGILRSDGLLEHHGRFARWTKVRGHKVQLAEVEKSLTQLDLVSAAVVLAVPNEQGDDELVAYLVSAPENRPMVDKIRRSLALKLPDYFIPTHFLFLEQLPLLGNGKVDRQRLPKPGRDRPAMDTEYVAPSTYIEKKVAALWLELFTIDLIGLHDDFFALGGHSLLAAQLIARIHAAFGNELTFVDFFDHPTVAGLATLIENGDDKQ